MITTDEIHSKRRKPYLRATSFTTTPHGMVWLWTRTSTTRDQRQTA